MQLEQANFNKFCEKFRIDNWKDVNHNTDALAIYGNIKDYTPLLDLPNLRYLWVAQADQKQFDIICRLTGLQKLGISWLRSISSLDPLVNLENLQTLSITGNLKEASLEPLGQLTQLRVLSLAALISTVINGGRIYCESFAPLANLHNLEYLELYAIKPRNGSLEPITHLKSLKELQILNMYSLEEYAQLAVALPYAEGIFHIPYHRTTGDDFYRCDKCGGTDLIILSGTKRRSFLCPSCDQQKFYEHIEKFNELKRKYSSNNT